MKKNILAIAILAACVANIALTSILLFSIIPAANNANKLVEKICTAINLELQNPDATAYAKVPIAQRETNKIGESYTVNLKRAEGESKNRYAIFNFSLVMNNKAADYETIKAGLDNHKDVLNDYVAKLIKECTADELSAKEEDIKKQVLSYCRTYFRKSDSEVGDELILDAVIAVTIN